MAAKERPDLPPDLARGRSRFAAWRRRRTGGRIPPPLWDLAVRLARRHGVSRTAIALSITFHRLDQRVHQTADPTPSSRPAFVELPAPLPAARQAVFELDNGAGVTMRVQLAGYEAADVEALAGCLWNAR